MKTALITGGSRGIGKASALQLAQDGYHVIINYLSNKVEADKVLAEILASNGSAELLPFNVAIKEEVDSALQKWHENNSEKYVEVLVNNAGIRKDNMMIWMKEEEWDQVIGISLNGFYNVTKALLQNMILKKLGSIINVVSLSGIKGMPGQTNYSAAKAAMIGATKSLAQEVGRKNVRVNAVAPGFVQTDMTEDIEEKDFKRIIPLGRFGKANEVADLISFLASNKSSYITGEVISINGGLYT